MATRIPWAEGEDRFDSLDHKIVLEEHTALRIQPAHSASWARLSNALFEQNTSILALIVETVIRFFKDAGNGTESGPDRTMISIIQIMFNRALLRGFLESCVIFGGGRCVAHVCARGLKS